MLAKGLVIDSKTQDVLPKATIFVTDKNGNIIDENGNIIFKTDGQIGPHIFKYDGKQSMFLPSREEWGSRGMKCTSVFTFQGSEEDLDISSNWKLTNCFCDDKECQSFSEVRNGSVTWWFDEPYWGCKCD